MMQDNTPINFYIKHFFINCQIKKLQPIFDTFVPPCISVVFFFFFFFLIAFPFFSHTAFYGTFRSAAFYNFPFFCLFSGDATGLRGTFPGHPRPFHLTFTDIHNIHRHTQHLYTHGRLFPTGLEPVLTSPWWPKEC
jgi:hypothetical protein